MDKLKLLIILLLVSSFSYFSFGDSPGKKSLIRFDHETHIALKMPCIGCHDGAGSQLRAGLPDTKLCSVCHSLKQYRQKSSEERKLRKVIKNRTDLYWDISNILPENVIFSHARHYRHGVDCSECHGKPGVRNFPALTGKVTMKACIDCHEQMNVSRDCFACHK